jgi:hypothetical protein
VDEKARKEWLGTCEELLWNLEYRSERYVENFSTQNVRNYGPECVKICSCMYSYFIALITNLLPPCFVLLQCSICRFCNESPPWKHHGIEVAKLQLSPEKS